MVNKFLKRWSSNKLTSQQALDAERDLPSELESTLPKTSDADEDQLAPPVAGENAAPEQTPLDTNEDSEELTVAGMLASGVTGAVKKQALRKLFLSGEFADVDNLNDYDHDYKAVKSLSQDAAKHLRNWLEEQADDEQAANEQTALTHNESQAALEEAQELDKHLLKESEATNENPTPTSITQVEGDLHTSNDQGETKSTT